MTGGSQGFISVFNHRIGKFIYKLEPVVIDSNNSSNSSIAVRVGSFQDMLRISKTSAGPIRSDIKAGNGSLLVTARNGSHTITALDFNDSYIVGCGMVCNFFIYSFLGWNHPYLGTETLSGLIIILLLKDRSVSRSEKHLRVKHAQSN